MTRTGRLAAVVAAAVLAVGSLYAGEGMPDLRSAQHAEFVAGDLQAAARGYEALTTLGQDADGQAAAGLVRTLRKLGRVDEARQRLDVVLAGTLTDSARARLEVERSLLSGAAAERKIVKEERRVVLRRKRDAAPAREPAARLTVDVKDTSLGDAVRLIEKQTGTSVFVTPSVAGRKVTLSFAEVEAQEALRTAAEAAGAVLARWAGDLAVTTRDEALRLGLDVIGTRPERSGPEKGSVLVEFTLRDGEEVMARPRVMMREDETGMVRIVRRTDGDEKDEPVKGELELMLRVTPHVEPTGRVRLVVDFDLKKKTEGEGGGRVQQGQQRFELVLADGEGTTVAGPVEGMQLDLKAIVAVPRAE